MTHCFHDERGRRTRRGNGPPKAETGRRTPAGRYGGAVGKPKSRERGPIGW
uniref:Uncharacterized protein n=1 Tax=Siphoviridae sp. ctwHj1 TaxID=2825727 RepID=A0A8S5U692_9CAUD|nr:MAG TPA: hypothetical protein [Siphoviridae sp. ctwHj1]